MDFKEIKGTKHYLYEDKNEFMVHRGAEFEYLKDFKIKYWKDGLEGDWIFTDDDCVCQILRRYKMKDSYYKSKSSTIIRTVCGTYNLDRKGDMIGEIPDNIYRLSKKEVNYSESKITSKKEKLFARYLAQGKTPIKAFEEVFDKSKSEDYKKKRVAELLTSDRISKMVSKEIESVLEDEGVSKSWLISRFKDIADLAERDGDKLRSLESLAKISGIYEHENAREQLTVWSGITPEQLQSIKKEATLIGHGEREVKEG